MPRSKLIDILERGNPTGAGELLGGGTAPVGTDAIPTDALGGLGPPPEGRGAPPPAVAPRGEGPEPEGVEPEGVQALAAAPSLSPEERAQLEAMIALAAREKLLEGLV